MPSLKAYAAVDDHLNIVRAILQAGEYALHPHYSPIDQDFIAYHTLEDLIGGTRLGTGSERLVVYHPSMGGSIRRRRLSLQPQVGTFRWEAAGWGLVSLVLMAPKGDALGPSWANHNSQKRAEKWQTTYAEELGPEAAWNWPEVARHAGKLVRIIRSLAVNKQGAVWVLPGASQLFATGRARATPV